MRQTIEIDVPEGYEFDKVKKVEATDPAGWMYVMLKPKQTKDFSFYVDQYLYENGSTNDQIVNWLSEDIISVAKHRLKTNQFSLVPWEVKMGLFRFILSEHKMPSSDITNFHISYGSGGDIGRSRFCKIIDICPIAFLDSLFG